MTWQGAGILGYIWKLKNSLSLWLIAMYVHENMTFDYSNDFSQYRCCAEQDLHANVRKLYTDTSGAGQWQIVTFVGCLP